MGRNRRRQLLRRSRSTERFKRRAICCDLNRFTAGAKRVYLQLQRLSSPAGAGRRSRLANARWSEELDGTACFRARRNSL
jgi:hypothetical protein